LGIPNTEVSSTLEERQPFASLIIGLARRRLAHGQVKLTTDRAELTNGGTVHEPRLENCAPDGLKGFIHAQVQPDLVIQIAKRTTNRVLLVDVWEGNFELPRRADVKVLLHRAYEV
jgi:hypothetical protein